MMRTLLVHWVLMGIALAVTAHFVPGVHVDSIETLLIAAAVVGLVNALVRPVLSFFSLPLTILSLGLFYLIINGTCFALAAWLVDGFRVDGLKPAVIGALCTSFVSWVLSWFVDDEEDREKKRKKKS
jgi:putative membrane protein